MTWMAGTSPAMTGIAPSPHCLQLARQLVSPLRDIAGAEADDIVARPSDAADDAGEIRRLLQRNHFAMAMRAKTQHKVLAVNPRNRRLAGRINLGDNDGIGIVETSAEFLKQRLQPREAMR